MATNNFKAFALDPNANVMSQADWEALPALLSGFISGPAKSAQMNKAIRQATFISSSIAQFVADQLDADVMDNGNSGAFIQQFTEALLSKTAGRLLNVQIFKSSGIYTPTSGAKYAIVEVQGAGGAGGGALVTAASTASTGAGGLSGAYTKGWVDNLIETSVIVGAAGAKHQAAAGGVGGDSSFGAIFAAGGLGGNIMSAGTSQNTVVAAGIYPSPDTSGGLYGVGLNYGQAGFRLSGTTSMSGVGGSSNVGAGGGPRGTSGDGFPANGFGGAGGGANCTAIGSYSGGEGGGGIVIVWEYA